MQRGNAFSTSANAVTVKKPVDDKVQKDASKKDVDEEIADSQILKNLGKYLLLNDSPDFRFRVALSLGLLVGAKVKAEICSLQIRRVCLDFCRRFVTHTTQAFSPFPL
jgi:hypothetical protein